MTRARRIPGEVARNDQLVRDLNEDLRRWVPDRDRQLTADLKKISAYLSNPDLEGQDVERLIGGLRLSVPDDLKQLPAGSLFYSGAHLRWLKGAKEQALHEYRDQAIRALRELDTVTAGEGRLHARKRLRSGSPAARLRLPAEAVVCLERLARPGGGSRDGATPRG